MRVDDLLDEVDDPDVPLRRLWKRRAVGMSSSDAILHVPKHGQLNVAMPKRALSLIRALASREGVSTGVWLRKTIAIRLQLEQQDPEVVAELLEFGRGDH